MPRRPPRQVCQLCLDDEEYLAWDVEGPGLWRYTCANPVHPDGHAWLTTGGDPIGAGGQDGISHQLGLYDDLLTCVISGEAYVEYGVIEHRYAVANPDTYKHIVGLYSHTGFGTPVNYTASALIGSALGKLSRDGLLLRRPCPATGFWKYNDVLNAWALPPGPADDTIVSWVDHAAAHGIPADTWPQELLR